MIEMLLESETPSLIVINCGYPITFTHEFLKSMLQLEQNGR